MIIVAESGATKTDWCSISPDGSLLRSRTEGFNPMTVGHEVLNALAGKAVREINPEGKSVRKVFFYGAGLVSAAVADIVSSIFSLWCPFAEIECRSDMEAAATALFGDGDGVVAIMGTGSNSCLWENGKVVRNIRPGGFILGDEGSAASLGRMFISDYIKGLVPEMVAKDFDKEFSLDYASIVHSVYKCEAPSRYLASFAHFVCAHRQSEYASGLIEQNIRSFMQRSLSRYGCRQVGVAGSFGFALKEEIKTLGKEYGLDCVRFIQSPIDQLIEYHRCHADR